jgi:PadR family transcriptional regulator AphA
MASGTAPSILGLLSWYPMSGYELKATIESTIGNFWSESFGQIYPELHRLERQGLVTSQLEPGENPKSKRRYSITDAGRDELRRWLTQQPKERPPRNELLLKIFFGLRAGPEAILPYVREARERFQQRITALRQGEASIQEAQKGNPHLPYWLITMRNGLLQYEAMLTWCDQTISELERLAAASKATNEVSVK